MPGGERAADRRIAPWLSRYGAPVLDVVLVIGMLGYAVGYLAIHGTAETYSPAGVLALLVGIGACLVASERHPVPAAILVILLVLLVPVTMNTTNSGPDTPDGVFAVLVVLFYRLGVRPRIRTSAIVMVALTATQLIVESAVNPEGGVDVFVLIATLVPWLVGVAVRLRADAEAELRARQRELEVERARYVSESVRLERAHIARELHDIVAHNVSLMVVQASAGEYLGPRDANVTATAFDHIAESARQAESEIARLVALLDPDNAPDSSDSHLGGLAELVRRIGDTGVSVTFEDDVGAAPLDPRIVGTSYRIVQEALTNAMRHAPGADLTVRLALDGERLVITVRNDEPPQQQGNSPLRRTGGGHGLVGLTERVSALGGAVRSAAGANGGWEVVAAVPIRISPAAGG